MNKISRKTDRFLVWLCFFLMFGRGRFVASAACFIHFMRRLECRRNDHEQPGDEMTTTVVLASGNAGKLREFNQLLAPLGMDVRPQSDFDVTEVEETG